MNSEYGDFKLNSELGTYTTENFELTKKHEFDAGLDICSNENIEVPARGRQLVMTGIRLKIPDGMAGLVWSRSGLSVAHGIEVGAGLIDSTYRGELGVLLYNHSDEPFEIKKGNRIAQLVTVPIMLDTYLKVETLDETPRGEGGFGSTGI
jgi:dUTP pyrophosphatase